MRAGPYILFLALFIVVIPALAQTTSPRTFTSVFDLQTALSPVTLDSNTQYVSGSGVRLVSSATSGTASFLATNAPFPVNNVVPSWNLDMPPGTGARMEVRAVNGASSTIWYEVARIGTIPGGIKRNTSDDYGYIDVDTLILYATWPCIEYRVTLYTNTPGVTPTLRLMSLCYADTNTLIPYVPLPAPGVTTSLPVPWRSQYWVPDIGDVICGPTSLSMAEDYYGCDLPTETVAADCYDDRHRIYGNWPFIAQAAAKRGFKAYTLRANNQQFLRDQFAAGNAVIMSMAYSAGELTNSPISSTSGHLVLMVGVTASGDYICNDPAGSDSRWDHVVYNAGQIAHVWLYHTGGVLIAVMPNLVYGRYQYYTYQSTAPVLTSWRGTMDLFARSIDGTIYWLPQSSPNGGWLGWTAMSGTAASSPTVATNRNKGNTVFARFIDGNLYYRAQTGPAGSWSSWNSLGGPVEGKPALGKTPDGRTDVFCRMPDGTVSHRWEAAGGGWQPWESLGGNMSGDPVVALTWEGREEVYARGTDSMLYWKYQLNDGSWSAWTSIGGPVSGQPAIGRTSDGRVEVYCRFADGTLRYNRQSGLNVGTSWTGWTDLLASPGSDPVSARTTDYFQDLFYTDGAGRVMHSRQTAPDGAWSSWESLGGTAVGPPIVGHHDDGRLQVFIFQSDGRLWTKSQLSGGGWGSWTVVGPALFADVTAPVINSVTVTPSLIAAGDQVFVQVTASDNVGVHSVTADGASLSNTGGGVWSGWLTSDPSRNPGWYSVLVEARDAANNVSTDNQHGYAVGTIVSIPNRSAFDEIMLDARARFLFTVWGRVNVLSSNSFTLDDGSGMPITVYAENHGLTTGQYAKARGILSRPSPTEAVLTSSPAFVQRMD